MLKCLLFLQDSSYSVYDGVRNVHTWSKFVVWESLPDLEPFVVSGGMWSGLGNGALSLGVPITRL